MRKFGAFLLCFACRAEQLPVKRYTTADGLAGNRVECILRDSHGFLWFGTTEGLSRARPPFGQAVRGAGLAGARQ